MPHLPRIDLSELTQRAKKWEEFDGRENSEIRTMLWWEFRIRGWRYDTFSEYRGSVALTSVRTKLRLHPHFYDKVLSGAIKGYTHRSRYYSKREANGGQRKESE